MENQEEKQSNDAVKGKIITFASPTILAAILDEQLDQDVVQSMVDPNEQDEMVADSLDNSLNDSLESTKLREIGDVGGAVGIEETEHAISVPLVLTDDQEAPDFPKSSTPAQNDSEEKRKITEKAPKPRRSQHIIERNKEKVGKRVPAKTSYAQMHASKARNKLDKNTEKKTKTLENAPGSNLGNQLKDAEGDNNDLNQSSYFENHVGQIQPIDMNNSFSSTSQLQQQESDLFESSDLNGAPYVFQNHGPYYDVQTQYSSYNYGTYESCYNNQPATYARGYHSAAGQLRQSHAATEPVPPLHYNNLTTQSAPPGVYGYERKPLLTSLHYGNFNEEDYHLSSVLPNKDFVSSDRRDTCKIPESSLHRKFSSEPYLAQSSSPSLQKMANVGRNSKASGSYSSLRQPFEYKPYTLKEYQNFAGSKVKPLAGGLGPNVDTDDFKEKMKKVSKQREYATMLRAQHSSMRKQQDRKGPAPAPVKANHLKEAEKKREAALNYAKNVPKPKQLASKKQSSRSGKHGEENRGDDDQDITVLEILRMRHEQEKKEVESIRKELASKIRL